jgi:protein-tyrosine-phosphatase
MAQAFALMAKAEAWSAGSKPSGTVNPKAIESMARIGYDLSSHESTSIDAVADQSFDLVATMGCGDACPHVPARFREDWEIPDPKQLDTEEFDRVRDQIRDAVAAAVERVKRESV